VIVLLLGFYGFDHRELHKTVQFLTKLTAMVMSESHYLSLFILH
jgi:hypothetical protein